MAGGPTGVDASDCGIGALVNGGRVDGANGAASSGTPTDGGVGVLANAGQSIGGAIGVSKNRRQSRKGKTDSWRGQWR